VFSTLVAANADRDSTATPAAAGQTVTVVDSNGHSLVLSDVKVRPDPNEILSEDYADNTYEEIGLEVGRVSLLKIPLRLIKQIEVPPALVAESRYHRVHRVTLVDERSFVGRICAPIIRPVALGHLGMMCVHEVLIEGTSAFGPARLRPSQIRNATLSRVPRTGGESHEEEPANGTSGNAGCRIRLKKPDFLKAGTPAELRIANWRVAKLTRTESEPSWVAAPGVYVPHGVAVMPGNMDLGLTESFESTEIPINVAGAGVMLDLRNVVRFDPVGGGKHQFILKSGENATGQLVHHGSVLGDSVVYFLTGDSDGVTVYINSIDVDMFEPVG